ncbi:MAG: methylmalonate-semialdehyde dehydrogenase [Thermoleophilia bacterium]|nr:methylmalonate-semialdehyde dehydrogenase [Thermoleophilia bacterium]
MTTTSAPSVTALTHWVDGARDETPAERLLDVHNPATGEVVTRVPMATVADVDRVVAAAKAALPGWRETSMTKRAQVMFAFREQLNARKAELAEVVTREHGKVHEDAMGEVTRGLEVVEFACGMPHLIKGEHAEQVSGGIDIWSIRQPLGVVAGITPFNFPAMVPMWMFPIAIAAGNTFVLKPSEKDPSAANLIACMLKDAGLPPGVFNVLHGDAVAVNRLIEHPDVAAISSVSSTPVARHVYETATKQGKRVQALGGAKNHMVVLPDADMDLAADAAIGAAFGSAGQRCMAVSVLVAVGDAADRLRPKLEERMAKLTTGPGNQASSEMGPLVTAEARDRVADYVAQGEAAGADLVVDGRTLRVDGHDDGFWVGPTLFDNVTTDMSIYREEIFGPVLDIVRVDSYADALEMVNASEYANGVAIFTNDGGAARRFQHEVEVGMIGINVPVPVPMAYFSFGGWKASLFGDTHMHGMEGVRFFTRAKAITGRWPDPSHRGVNLGFPTN